ncbi:MAG TPA: 30S ribosomal protein S12 methylthiotransferase RimO [Longimicrobiales bacterium]|nr:30S ribosomal protein S12 methylthiotransferase RimO [Longimicrobiales bacterium]
MAIRSDARRIQLPIVTASTAPETLRAPVPEPGPDAPRIGVITLGCDKNTVDTERLLARLAHAGGHVIDDAAAADVVVINTCGFIDVAKEESVDAILEAIRMKQHGGLSAVVAMGCLVQRYKSDLQRELPDVDLFLGLTEAEQLVPELRSRGLLPDVRDVPVMERPLRRIATSTRHTSYLKISEGCDHACAFCAIPLMRGRHRSAPIDVLVQEARELEAAGVVELNIISQDTTWYGRDLVRGGAPGTEWFVGKPFDGMPGPALPDGSARAGLEGWPAGRRGLLPDLLRALLDETSIPWLRLFYMYPSGIRRELVELMAAEPRILPYLDMPIQHGADAVLTRMRRPERQGTIRERVAWLRAAIPDVALRTTVIVGFPGETDEEFADMLRFLEEVRFDHLGAFAYSAEEATPAAGMPGQVPPAVVRERLEQLLDLQSSIAQERNEEWVGREVAVLVDALAVATAAGPGATPVRAGAVGRTGRQALDIDGVVHLADAASACPGQFINARITGVVESDMRAELTGNAER